MNKIQIKSKIKNIAIILLVAIFFIADRGLKTLALTRIWQPGINLLGSWFQFRFVANHYIAFSLPLFGWLINALILLIILVLIITIIYLILNKNSHKLTILLLTTILLGAISNILDRWLYGYVIDYLSLKYFTIFNLADVMITGGAVYLIIFQIPTKYGTNRSCSKSGFRL
jgi:signal peptidase II